ncbi:MAG: alanine--tRNA ligase-related protein, partial [Candidatus Bathyarchaeota archaeon]|nr:alanine--tRNA ligase-related protein [Candidatus Bathyarchaeota archaeon]
MAKLSELVKSLEKTQLLYWADPYLKTLQAKILSLEPDKKHNVYVVLDKTIFHPKSGGQPSDRGLITGSDFEVKVKKAMLVNGVIVHWGKILEGEPKGGRVGGEIDWDWRYLLMRRHTAGHLYDHCLTQVTGKRVETTDS